MVIWNLAPVLSEDDDKPDVPKMLCQMDNHLGEGEKYCFFGNVQWWLVAWKTGGGLQQEIRRKTKEKPINLVSVRKAYSFILEGSYLKSKVCKYEL